MTAGIQAAMTVPTGLIGRGFVTIGEPAGVGGPPFGFSNGAYGSISGMTTLLGHVVVVLVSDSLSNIELRFRLATASLPQNLFNRLKVWDFAGANPRTFYTNTAVFDNAISTEWRWTGGSPVWNSAGITTPEIQVYR